MTSRPPGQVRVKVCGITRAEDALGCVAAGAHALGFVLWPGSPRGITMEAAGAIVERLPPFVTRVGVFVNERTERILDAARRLSLDVIQLSGDEDAASCTALAAAVGTARIVKALRPAGEPARWHAPPHIATHAWLLEAAPAGTYGGSGRPAPWDAARRFVDASSRPVILAGGLTPDNVAGAIRRVTPAAVDVASGVETSPGVKDLAAVRAFLAAAGVTA